MKMNPRTGGVWWPACVFLVMILLLPLMAFSQETGAGDDEEPVAGAASEEADVGDVSVVDEEDAITTTPDEMEEVVEEIPAEPVEYDFDFRKPTDFRVVDRASDEGGAFALLWPPSSSDELMTEITDPETGETVEATAYEYWPFHSPTGLPGSWELLGPIPTNSQYVWNEPQFFGFFLSDQNKGSNEHYTFYENTYPARGVYAYSIASDEEDPGILHVGASVYDDTIEDYAGISVICGLKPIGGDKVELSYVPPEPGQERLPWDNPYEAAVSLDISDVLITKSYYILFTAPVNGVRKAALEVQLDKNEDGNTVVGASGNEPPVPDNRDQHWFRLYVVPTAYVLPGDQEFPPDEWMIGNQVGPFIAHENLWNAVRTNTFVFCVFITLSVMGYILVARRGGKLFIRRIAGLDHVDEAIGRATEMGRPILYVTGLGYMSDIATIASVNILGQVARKVADYETRLLVPSRDPIVMAVCQEVVQEAYIDSGRPDAYNKDDIFFLTDDQFAYTAAVDGIMVREKPATNFFMGMFYAESLLLAETGSSTGAIQIAGTDALAQLPFFITACDYTLIGEELYAASAYISREPLLLGSLKGQDLAKLVFMVGLFLGTLLVCLNTEFIRQLFQSF